MVKKNEKKNKKNEKKKVKKIKKGENKIKKKRGRKPKGGKIVKKRVLKSEENNLNNIILHFKCSIKEVINYDFNNNSLIELSIFNSKKKNIKFKELSNNNCENKNEDENIIIKKKENNIKEIWNKLRKLKYEFHNNTSYKKSNCFWCTCSFVNNPIFIPKRVNKKYEVYGCFCSPECAVAYLLNEKISDNILWERYSLLNNLYSKIYDYKKNIKPAGNPYYLLDKYYGNLSIQEYRQTLSNNRIYFVVDKPKTKIMPELYEDNNDLPMIYNDILNKKPIKNKYVLKRNNNANDKKSFFNI